MKNKELGSDFNLFLSPTSNNLFVEDKEINLFFSGRTALYSLLKWGIQNKAWKNVLFPSYYCHEVVDFIRSLPINVEYFNFNPFIGERLDIELEGFDKEGNVFINVDYFGLTKVTCYNFQYSIVIDDLTHNFDRLYKSEADYCFGSLRKILPTPCGGFLFSSLKNTIPVEFDKEFSESISIQKLSAMYLKTQYLSGKEIDKNLFRKLYLESEESFSDRQTISKIPLSALSVLQYLDLDYISTRKKENLKLILDEIIPVKGVTFNLAKNDNSAFGLLLQFKEIKMRDELRLYLISNKIYPAVLWPNQFREEDIYYSNLILFLHIDFRYNKSDIIYLGSILNIFFRKYGTNN